MVMEGATLALNELCSATIIVNRRGRILYHTGPGLEWIGASYPGVLPERISGWLNLHNHKRVPQFDFTSDAGTVRLRAVPTNAPERLLLVLTRENSSPPAASPDNGLTKRELEVAAWIREGKTTSEIAMILGVSPRTVHKHVEHIYEKTGADSRAGLAAHFNYSPR